MQHPLRSARRAGHSAIESLRRILARRANAERVNTVIRILILSDFFLLFALGLLSPIFAVYVLDHVGGTIAVVGFSASVYWISRVLFVLPLSRIMDRIAGEHDEYLFMIAGTILMSCIPIFYLVATEVWHIYLIQVINGLANAMAIPSWRVLFTNHVDRHRVGYEWSLEDVTIGVATATSAALGAFIADRFGFPVLFLIIFYLGLTAAFILAVLAKREHVMLKLLIRRRRRIATGDMEDAV